MEYISIHIPKTGGQAFHRNLKHAFGENEVRYWFREDVVEQSIDGLIPVEAAKSEKVWHGHFFYIELSQVVSRFNPRLITWFRDPIDRVISHHRFFIKRLNDPPETHKEAHRINMHRREESLLTFAAYEENRNVMTKVLDGVSLDSLFFFGLMEHFDSDLKRLEQLTRLDFGPIEIVNRNADFKVGSGEVSKAERDQIREWNSEDVNLYAEVKRRLGR